MDMNPLAEISHRYPYQKLESDIKELKASIDRFIGERNCMEKLVELGLLQGDGNDLAQKKVSINPKYIVFVEEDNSHAYVHMSNESILHTVESRSEILKLIEGSSSPTYIG